MPFLFISVKYVPYFIFTANNNTLIFEEEINENSHFCIMLTLYNNTLHRLVPYNTSSFSPIGNLRKLFGKICVVN